MAGRLVYQPRQVAPPGAFWQGAAGRISSVPCQGSPPSGAGRQGKVMATTTGNAQPEALGPEGQLGGEGVRRRDFINIAAVSAAGVGAAATLYPLIS